MDSERFAKQILFSKLGAAGQQAIEEASLLLVGAGAIGSSLLALLARAGVGRIRIVDDDCVDLGNLHRQQLFREQDIGVKKVYAAAQAIADINSLVRIEPLDCRLNSRNVKQLLAGCILVVDGTDSVAARFLVNQACLAAGIPWVYSGVTGSAGVSASFSAVGRPCFQCLVPGEPPAGSVPDSQQEGIMGSAVWMTTGVSAMQVIRILAGQGEYGRIRFPDSWNGSGTAVYLDADPSCPCCGSQ